MPQINIINEHFNWQKSDENIANIQTSFIVYKFCEELLFTCQFSPKLNCNSCQLSNN